MLHACRVVYSAWKTKEFRVIEDKEQSFGKLYCFNLQNPFSRLPLLLLSPLFVVPFLGVREFSTHPKRLVCLFCHCSSIIHRAVGQ